MKKVLYSFILLLISFIFISFDASAEEVAVKEITSTTSIANDFEILGLDINDFYKPKSYDYDKWYVVAAAEDMKKENDYNIQSYIYVFNPFDKAVGKDSESFMLYYNFSDGFTRLSNTSIAAYDAEHLIYKLEAFRYNFVEKEKITISKITYTFETRLGTEEEPITQEVDFSYEVTHSKEDGCYISLEFDSLLILEEYDVLKINIEQDNNFFNFFNKFYGFAPTNMYVYFYNFNFPERIKYDDVTYAKFEYDYIEVQTQTPIAGYEKYYPSKYEEKSRTRKPNEYYPGDQEIQVNGNSQKLTFPTIYLGNRLQDNQFGDLEVSGDVESFNYDCSILLDYTYATITPMQMHIPDLLNGTSLQYVGNYSEYTAIDKVEILELHYENDGITYKCQVAGGLIDDEDFSEGTAKDPTFSIIPKWWENLLEELKQLWDKLLAWIEENPIQNIVIAIIVAILSIAVIAALIWALIKYILRFILKLIFKIILLPFKLIFGH